MKRKYTGAIGAAILPGVLLMGCGGGAASSKQASQQQGTQQPEPGTGALIEVEREVVQGAEEVPVEEGCEVGEEVETFRLACPGYAIDVSKAATSRGAQKPIPPEVKYQVLVKEFNEAGFEVEGPPQKRTMTVAGEEVSFDRIKLRSDQEQLIQHRGWVKRDGLERRVLCTIEASGGDEQASRVCPEAIGQMVKYAEARKVVGLKVRGERVKVPKSCQLGDRAIACGAGKVFWLEHPTPQDDSVAQTMETRLQRLVAGSGGTATRAEARCTFGGEALKCLVFDIEIPSQGVRQLTYLAWGNIEDRYIQFICDQPYSASGQAELPCSLFFEATLESGTR